VPFTPKAFDLLVVLTANPGRLLTKEQLMQAVWPDAIVEESNLAYHVFAIRKALGESADGKRFIETVPKRGYRFVAPVRVEADGRATGTPNLWSEPGTVTLDPSDRTLTAAAGTPAVDHAEGFPGRRRTGVTLRVWLGLAGALGLAALLVRSLEPGVFGTPSLPITSVHFQEPVTGRLAETGMFSVSPDGRRWSSRPKARTASCVCGHAR
jgi:DNA-binding winged helix-turn-helix (wHTH) protein